MKRKIITFLSAGIIIGFVIGGTSSINHILTNRYIQYKLVRLPLLIFQEKLNFDVSFYFIGLVILNMIIIMLFKWIKFSTDKLITFNIMSIVILTVLLIGDEFFIQSSGYTILLALKKLSFKIGEFINEKESSDYFHLLYNRYKTNLSILLIFIVMTIPVFWLLLKVSWEKASKCFRTAYINRTALGLVILLAILNLGVVIDGKINSPKGPNIILILVDTLRADHLGSYGYSRDTSPNIDKLAQNGVIFTNAYSNAPWTKPSVASIFSSLYPNVHKAINTGNVLPEGVLTIAEIMKNEGYYTAFLNSGNPTIGRKFNFHQGFDHYSHPIRVDLENAKVLTDKLLPLITKLQKKKFFIYLHYMDTHVPYNKNKYNNLFINTDNKHGFGPGEVDSWKVRALTSSDKLSNADKDYLIALYDGQIRFVDSNIKKIIRALKDKNILEDTLVILTSDHGEEFWEHDNYEHGHTLYNELLHVPLIIYGSHKVKPGEVKERIRLIDLFPTILEMANIDDNMLMVQGKSIFKTLSDNKSKLPVFSMGTFFGDEKYSLIEGNNKIILNTGNEENKNKLEGKRSKDFIELYDSDEDPFEKNNLSDSESDVIAQLQEKLYKFKNAESPFENFEIEIDEELKERLKSLGYLQ